MVVLHEQIGDTQFSESAAMVSFHEKTARVAKNVGAEFIDAGKSGFNSLHRIRAPVEIATQTKARYTAMILSDFVATL
jgi:hypothetical protein